MKLNRPGLSISPTALILHTIILVVGLFLSLDAVKNYSYFLFGSQLLLFYLQLYRYRSTLLYLTPIMLTITYVDASFMLGNWAYSHRIFAIPENYNTYLGWEHTQVATAYMLLVNIILFYIDCKFHSKYLTYLKSRVTLSPSSHTRFMLYISLGFFVIFSVVSLPIDFLGGSGEMSIVPRTVSVLVLFYLLASRGSRTRYLLYLICIAAFAVVSFDSKREAVFLVFPIVLLEAFFSWREVSLKLIALISTAIVILVALILVMSVLRGYGGFQPLEGEGQKISNVMRTPPYLVNYVKSQEFLPYFFLNIETNYHYYHSMNAIELIQGQPDLLAYGSTIGKVIFTPLPSSWIGSKPDSAVGAYTSVYAPSFRAMGGSWAVNIYSEGFWNFHVFGVVYIAFLYYLLSCGFCWLLGMLANGCILSKTWVLFAYMQVLALARGCGIDIYFIDTAFAMAFSIVYLFLGSVFLIGSLTGTIRPNSTEPTEAK